LDLAALKAGILGEPELQVKRILKDLAKMKAIGAPHLTDVIFPYS
jgi:hypothetical protein